MKKIVFVNPPLSMYERYRYLSLSGSTFPNLGILQLAAIARQNGFKTAVIDAPSQNLDEEACFRRIMQWNPDIVGFSAVTSSVLRAASLAERLKQASSDLVTILGGVHISAIPEETMSRFPCFDLGVIGEGELTLADVFNRIRHKDDLTGVDGTVCREHNGQVVVNRREERAELDDLPYPAWDLLPGFPHKYRPATYKFQRLPATYLVSSRGCPYTCSFCDSSLFGKKVRYFSVDYLIDQIRELTERYGIREIVFEDDVFLLDRKRVVSFCEKLLENHIKISWSCNARADNVDYELFKLIRSAGCWLVSFGVESGDQEILDKNAKSLDLERIGTAIDAARSAGIFVKGFFILGLPGETETSMRKSIEFAKNSTMTDVSISKMTPFPGTEIYEKDVHSGRFDKDWMNMNLLNSVYIPDGLTEELLDRYYKDFLREFYLRRSIIFQYARRILLNPKLASTYLKSAGSLVKAVSK